MTLKGKLLNPVLNYRVNNTDHEGDTESDDNDRVDNNDDVDDEIDVNDLLIMKKNKTKNCK